MQRGLGGAAKSFQLPAGEVLLSYNIQYDTEWAYDFIWVQVSQDGGNTYDTLLQLSGVSDWSSGIPWPWFPGWYLDILREDFPTLVDIQGPDELGFVGVQSDLSAYQGNVELRFLFTSDVAWSDEDGLYDSNGATRIDDVVIRVDGEVWYSEDFEIGAGDWVASTADIEVLQGYDVVVLGWSHSGYNNFSIAESGQSQGYINPVYDALLAELRALECGYGPECDADRPCSEGFVCGSEGLCEVPDCVEWNANCPEDAPPGSASNPPDLSTEPGREAVDVVRDLQALWGEDEPVLILWGRDSWGGYACSGTGHVCTSDDDCGADESCVPVWSIGWVPAIYNFNNPDLSSVEVRQAISLAFDRQGSIDAGGAVAPHIWLTKTPILPSNPAYDPAESDAVYDPLKALELMRQAGYPVVDDPGELEEQGYVD